MIARIVPLTKLRRPTNTWSYIVPRGSKLVAGSLVSIRLGNRKLLGIVWEILESDGYATRQIEEIITYWPVMRAPLRRHAEWLASTSPVSLSTIVTWMLPAAFSKPLTPTAKKILEHFIWEPKPQPQQIILLPSEREETENALTKRFSPQRMWHERNGHHELERWLQLQNGNQSVIGREHSLYAPLPSVRQIIIIEPENISYSLEQQPGISLVEAAQHLAKEYQAELIAQSYLPARVESLLYNAKANIRRYSATTELVDLRHSPLVSNEVLTLCRECIANAQTAFFLLNAHDRFRADEDMLSTRLPGVESFTRSLASALGVFELPLNIVVGTRAALQHIIQPIHRACVVSLDPLIQTEQLADELHGLADIAKLAAKSEHLIIQTWQPTHSLVQALLQGTFEQYVFQRIDKRKSLKQPPFASQVLVLSPAATDNIVVTKVYSELQNAAIGSEWLIGSPSERKWYGKNYNCISLYHPDVSALLTSNLRNVLGKLARPWRIKVDRYM